LHNSVLAEHIAQLSPAWQPVFQETQVAQAIASLSSMLADRLHAGAQIYPSAPFSALMDIAPSEVRVVILGQDPYHGPGQAQGLAFSVPDGMKRPPSLRNIFKEIGIPLSQAESDLTRWVRQGVFLLNTVLTVEDGSPASHAKKGWEVVTDALIRHVANQPQPKVFMLWGAHAQQKQALIPTTANHLVLMANHPSPLSASRPPLPFLGCGHFEQANLWLQVQGHSPVSWKFF
jgi:uracil-DNA glycosylase